MIVKVGESKYLFEAKTVKRMEILVLSTLGWKMNPVTPLSFLDYITRKLGLKGHLCLEFLRRCETVLLSVFTGNRLTYFQPDLILSSFVSLSDSHSQPLLLLMFDLLYCRLEIYEFSSFCVGNCDDDARGERCGAWFGRGIPRSALGYSGNRQGCWRCLKHQCVVF